MAEHSIRLTVHDLESVLRPSHSTEPNTGAIKLTESDLRQVLEDPRTSDDMELEAIRVDWMLLEEYGPGQTNGIRNPELVDDETMNLIERAQAQQAESTVLNRVEYVRLREEKRQGYIRGRGVEGFGADIQAAFIDGVIRRRLV